jgi:3-oxoacyl-[acyl-carrier-protein] synthase II
MLIESGQMEFAIVGGTDTVFSPAVFSNWCALRILSTMNQIPERACKPFSQNRDGIVLGEGAGILILESEAFAERRGALPLAEVVGYGSSADSLHILNQNVHGQAQAIRNALKDANITSSEVDYISAHATGTKVNDANETQAIKTVFGDQAYRVPVSGIKPALGHTLAASAALEAIVCVLAMNKSYIPATLNYEQPDLDCDLDYVTDGSRRAELNICVSNSFGFGGTNGVIVLSKPTLIASVG